MRTLLYLLMSIAISAAAQTFPDEAELTRMIARFAPTRLEVDTSALSPGDKQALVKLIQAARIVNPLFLEQLWSGNPALYKQLREDKSPLGVLRLHYFWINKGPWSEIDEHKAFMPGVPAKKPLGANFYPEDMTKDEFESWVKTLSPQEKEQAEGFFTVIRRGPDKKLTIVPYSQEYKTHLDEAAKLLREAAALTGNASLKTFLNARAAAFSSNDYYESDMAWMDLDAPLDITFGPYETYNDELFGYKAAFEAYINLRDDKETAKLQFLGQHLQEIENNLPEDPQFRVPKLGAAAPIRVVNEIFSAGDGAHGVQTAAYNLPNDDKVVQQKGSKRVMLKNIQQAKFESILKPISKVVLQPAAQKDLSFELFFTHIVAHELTHGLGPHQIRINGRQTNPRLELKELYSAIEEAKADVTGLFALQYLMTQADKGSIQAPLPHGPDAERRLYTTYLASSFRTLRFGLQDAHAKGMAVQFNYFLDKGGFVANADGTFSVDVRKMKEAVASLDHEFLTLEATGDYAGAKKLISSMMVIRPEVQKALDRLKSVPTDIAPVFVTADALTKESTVGAGASAALARMDEGARHFKSARADVKWERYTKLVNDTDLQAGRIYARRSNSGLEVAIEVLPPHPKQALLKHNKVVMYDPKLKQATERDIANNADAESMMKLGFAFGVKGEELLKDYDVTWTGWEVVDGIKTAKLELLPRKESLSRFFSKAILWIDLERDVAIRQQRLESSGDYWLAHYTNIELNGKVSDDVFTIRTDR
jgi:outer membrane lipoprotein-sorting protein